MTLKRRKNSTNATVIALDCIEFTVKKQNKFHLTYVERTPLKCRERALRNVTFDARTHYNTTNDVDALDGNNFNIN